MDGLRSLRGTSTGLSWTDDVLTQRLSSLPFRHTSAVRIGDLAQDRAKMTPFSIQQVWRAGRPVPVSEKGSTLALLPEATVQRITTTVISATGCPCGCAGAVSGWSAKHEMHK